MSTFNYQLDTFLITIYSLYCTGYLKLLALVLMAKTALKTSLLVLLFLITFLQVSGQEDSSFITQQEVMEGQFLMYFVNNEEETIPSPVVTFPATVTPLQSYTSNSALGSTDRILRIDNMTLNSNIDLSIAPDLGVTGNFENEALWFSSESSYPIYSQDSNNGRLEIDPTSLSVDSTGCESVLSNVGSPMHFLFIESEHENNVESIDIATISDSSMCRIDFQGVSLSQIIPVFQSPGFYTLEMVLTATTYP